MYCKFVEICSAKIVKNKLIRELKLQIRTLGTRRLTSKGSLFLGHTVYNLATLYHRLLFSIQVSEISSFLQSGFV